MMVSNFAADHVVSVVADAGGQIVGRTRLQKIMYLLAASGIEESFTFEYRHYGPFSDGLAEAAQIAELLGDLTQKEHQASWGGTYSIFRTERRSELNVNDARHKLISVAAQADSVELELAATAVFLAKENHPAPWQETARRKPEKAAGRLKKAKALYAQIRAINTPIALPILEK